MSDRGAMHASGGLQPSSPWAAAACSAIAPGLGQLYNGRRAKAVAICLPLAALLALALLLSAIGPKPAFGGWLAWQAGLRLTVAVSIIEAFIEPLRRRNLRPAKPIQRTRDYLVWALLIHGTIAAGLTAHNQWGYLLAETGEAALPPALLPGETLLGMRTADRTVQPNKLVIYREGAAGGEPQVGRILPADGPRLLLDRGEAPGDRPLSVPAMIDRDRLLGRPVWILWSRDERTGEIRWNRLGRLGDARAGKPDR